VRLFKFLYFIWCLIAVPEFWNFWCAVPVWIKSGCIIFKTVKTYEKIKPKINWIYHLFKRITSCTVNCSLLLPFIAFFVHLCLVGNNLEILFMAFVYILHEYKNLNVPRSIHDNDNLDHPNPCTKSLIDIIRTYDDMFQNYV